jgi:uncharacterized protein (DUF2345 family)
MSNLVMTQFGPIPRDMLEAKDEISETSNSREVATVWTLKEQVTLVLPNAVIALNTDGTQIKLEQGQAITLMPGQLMRRSAAVEVLMPQGLSGAQAQM